MNSQETLNLLLTRRSVKAAEMIEPGPSAQQIEQLLCAAHRVPDHGKIGPWRFVVVTGNARIDFGQHLQKIYTTEHPEASEKLIDHQATLLLRAPCVIVVIASPDLEHPKVPEWEQLLSVGAACQNLLLATHALGFVGQWLTEWCAYSPGVNQLLKLADHEKIAGYIHVGSMATQPEERPRPSLNDRVRYW
jgi:nitroreductase